MRRLASGNKPKLYAHVIGWSTIGLPVVVGAFGSDVPAALGHSGLIALAFAVATGIRSRFAETLFGSLIDAYRFHHRVSVASVCLFFAHVIAVAEPFLSVSWRMGRDFLLDLGDPTVTTGWLALGALVAVLAFSFRRKIRRPLWLKLHQAGASLGWAIAFLHFGFARGGEFSLVDFLTFLATAGGLLIVTLHIFFPSLLRPRGDFEVAAVSRLSQDVIEIELRPLRDLLRYYPGQFAYLSFHCTKGCGVTHEFHPFTLASSPKEPNLRMVIKALGDDTSRLMHLEPGVPVTVEGPYGNLLDLDIHEPQLWIAGGIGIAPFLSYLRALTENQNNIDVEFIILVHRRGDSVFGRELEDFGNAFPRLRIHLHVDEEHGRFTPSRLDQVVPDWHDREVALSGPSSLIHAFENAWRRGPGTHNKPIHMEAFDF